MNDNLARDLAFAALAAIVAQLVVLWLKRRAA